MLNKILIFKYKHHKIHFYLTAYAQDKLKNKYEKSKPS